MQKALLIVTTMLLLHSAYADSRTLSEKEVSQVDTKMTKVKVQKLIGQPCDSRPVEGGDIRHFYKVAMGSNKAVLALDFNKADVSTFKMVMGLDGVKYMPEYKSKCW